MKTYEDVAPKFGENRPGCLTITPRLTLLPHPAIYGETQNDFIPHPPYSSDLAPCDTFLFPKMKLKLKGHQFDTIEEI
jgi:hypothetical protein